MENEKVYCDEKFIKALNANMQMSPTTWHKVMNPMCGECMAERGREVMGRLSLGRMYGEGVRMRPGRT